jgi:hypothetical protein
LSETKRYGNLLYYQQPEQQQKMAEFQCSGNSYMNCTHNINKNKIKMSRSLNKDKKGVAVHYKCMETRDGIKKPTQKNPQKNHLKNPLKWVFWFFLGFFKFFIFYENNTNFSLSNRFFMNK